MRGGIARGRRVDGKRLNSHPAGPSVYEGERLWAQAMLVTDAKLPIEAVGQFYRDHADCENSLDELENQWGLQGGAASPRGQPKRHAWRPSRDGHCWWPRCDAPRSAGGQTTLYLTPLHGKANPLKPLIVNFHAALQQVNAAAEQFEARDRWTMTLSTVCDRARRYSGRSDHRQSHRRRGNNQT